MQFDRSSERITGQIGQLALQFEDVAEDIKSEDRPHPLSEHGKKKRKQLLDRLPRQENALRPPEWVCYSTIPRGASGGSNSGFAMVLRIGGTRLGT
jgi:hypothetical protein